MPLGVYPKGLKTYVHINSHIQTFILAVPINCHNLKAIKMPSVGEWMNELWYSSQQNIIHH